VGGNLILPTLEYLETVVVTVWLDLSIRLGFISLLFWQEAEEVVDRLIVAPRRLVDQGVEVPLGVLTLEALQYQPTFHWVFMVIMVAWVLRIPLVLHSAAVGVGVVVPVDWVKM
jgi:hypothetical protein